MTKPTVNELTGEVTAEIGGHTFTLLATMPNVAALQAALGIPGLRALNAMIGAADPRVAYHGLKSLCISGNASSVDGLLFGKCGMDAIEAVSEALIAGMPEPDDETDDGGAAKTDTPGKPTTQSPGGA